jgi:hypothetical protein
MKKALLFLLLFAAGLGVLLLVQELTRKEPVDPRVQDVIETEVPGPIAPEIMPEIRDEQGQLAVSLKAPLRITQFRLDGPWKGNKEYELTAQRLQPVLRAPGDPRAADESFAVDLFDVHVELWSPETETLETELDAAEARVLLRIDANGQPYLDEARPTALRSVDLIAHEGMPLAPLRANVPVMDLMIASRRITSESEVLLEGSGLTTTGRGLDIDETSTSFRLLENPSVKLRLDDGTRAELSSTGQLEILAREDLGPEHISISAAGSARLELRQAEPTKIEADRIVLLGRSTSKDPVVPDSEGSFALERGEARGSVALTLESGAFFGDEAVLSFDDLGEPKTAVLDGSPHFTLELAGLGTGLEPLDSQGQPLPLEASGAGPLTLGLGSTATLDFAGPVHLELPSLSATLDATQRLTGSRSEASGFAILLASGDVVVRHRVEEGDSALTAEEIEIGSYVDITGERVATLTAVQATRTTGTLRDGRPFTLVTNEGIVVERRGDDLLVPQAGQVELTVEGEDGFFGRADTVSDLDVNAFAFVAAGDVRVESDRGNGRGERLESFGPERMDLYGSEGAPARFEVTEGTLEGGVISLDGQVLDVREAARTDVELAGQRYGLSSRWARLDRSGLIEGEQAEGHVVLDAGGDVDARTESPEGWMAATRSDFFRVRAREIEGQDGSLELEPLSVLASGNARMVYEGDFRVEGEGDRLEIDGAGNGVLLPQEGERSRVWGELPREKRSFEMSSHGVEFSPETLEALNPDLNVVGFGVPLGAEAAGSDAPQRLRAVAGRMVCDRSSVLFTDGAYLGGFGDPASAAQDWSLDAEKVLLTGIPADELGETPAQEAVHDLLAWGGFVATLGSDISVRGEHVHVIRDTQMLRMAGEPASLNSPQVSWEAEWFDLNLNTGFVRAGSGRLRGIEDSSWALEYASIEPVEAGGATIQVVREPIVTSGQSKLRASWALFWVDTREWARISGSALGRDPGDETELPEIDPRPAPHPQSLFGQLSESGLTDWLEEIYIEGNIEYFVEGERKARAHSMYLDLIDGHGWMRQFDLLVDFPYAKRVDALKLRARWMYHSATGAFRAERAVATLCEFEEPHYVIRIGDLSIEPRMRERPLPRKKGPDGEPLDPDAPAEVIEEHDGWDISAGETAIELFGKARVPLPPLGVPVDEKLEVDSTNVSIGGLHPVYLGSAPKFGTFVGTSFSRELGSIASGFHRLLSGTDAQFLELRGQTDYRVSWNNDRGLLLGLTSEVRSPDVYWFDISADGVFDQGEDRGLIKVPESQRSSWRGWYRARGRYLRDDVEWVDFVATHQTDPGFQSEFFESEYLRFEERETYVHWRKAEGADYFDATVEVPLDDFRTEVVELPSLGHARGRTKIAQLMPGVPLQYASGTTLAYLARVEGKPTTDPSFVPTKQHEGPFVDGFGENETLRLDTRHRLETPFDTGVAGVRATPFLEGRATGWMQDAATSPTLGTSAEDPTRLALLGGIELATTVWRAWSESSRHVVSPFVGWRGSLAVDEDSEPLVKYDQVENPIDGRFVDVGVRTRWSNDATRDSFDLELVDTYAADSAVGVDGVWLPLEVRGTWLTEILGMGFGVSHDSRYDLEADRTTYSSTRVGWEPLEPVEIGVGYHSARSIDPNSPNGFAGSTLYNALSVAAKYAFSPKWEIEGLYTFSTLGDGRLASELGVRRFGHDFVFEVSTRFTAGEGGTAIKFDLTPLLAFNESRPGLVQYWRESGF